MYSYSLSYFADIYLKYEVDKHSQLTTAAVRLSTCRNSVVRVACNLHFRLKSNHEVGLPQLYNVSFIIFTIVRVQKKNARFCIK